MGLEDGNATTTTLTRIVYVWKIKENLTVWRFSTNNVLNCKCSIIDDASFSVVGDKLWGNDDSSQK